MPHVSEAGLTVQLEVKSIKSHSVTWLRRIRTARPLGAGTIRKQRRAAWDIADSLKKSAVGSEEAFEGSLARLFRPPSSDFTSTGSLFDISFPRGGLGALSRRRQDGEP